MEGERSSIRILQIKLKGLLGIRRMSSPKCMNKNGLEEEEEKRIDDYVLWWFSHMKRIENDKITKMVYAWGVTWGMNH